MKDIIQKKWLQLLTQAMNNELSLCALYARYAELFPEQAETWLVLSRSEEKHAALLRALLAGELAEVAEIPMDKLQSGPMDFITTQVASMIEKAATGEVMPTRAIASRSAVIPSFVTLPFSQCQNVCGRAASEGC